MATETIQVDEVLRDSGLAFLFLIDDDEVWVPHSVIESPEDIDVGDCEVEVAIASWFAEEKGLV